MKHTNTALKSLKSHPDLSTKARSCSRSAQPTLQNGHTQNLIRPEREAQRGPFASQYQDGKAPFRGLGVR